MGSRWWDFCLFGGLDLQSWFVCLESLWSQYFSPFLTSHYHTKYALKQFVKPPASYGIYHEKGLSYHPQSHFNLTNYEYTSFLIRSMIRCLSNSIKNKHWFLLITFRFLHFTISSQSFILQAYSKFEVAYFPFTNFIRYFTK